MNVTDRQVAELNALNAAYNSARADEKARTATAAQSKADAEVAVRAAGQSAEEAAAAQAREGEALKALADFTARLIDPVVGIEVTPGVPVDRPQEEK